MPLAICLAIVILATPQAGVTSGTDATSVPRLTSDKPDYRPGDKVALTGTGWAPNEVVTIVMTVAPATHAPVTLTSTSDDKGNFTNSDYVVRQSDLGVTFHLTATGATGDTAQTTFTDAIGTPVGIGTAGYGPSSGINSLSVTLTSPVAANNTVIVAVAALMTTYMTSVTVTDTAGNTYTKDADIDWSPSSYARTLVFSARVSTSSTLLAGNTITVKFDSTTDFVDCMNASAFSVSGLVAASPADKTATAAGTSTAASVGPTAATTQADELLIGAFGVNNNSGGIPTFAKGAGYTLLPSNANDTATGIFPEYQIVNLAGTYSANGTLSGNYNPAYDDWAGAIVTYKAVTPGPATQLAFTTQPGGGTIGTAWTTQPAVAIQDANGNPTSATDWVTLAIGTNPGGGLLSCTTNPVQATSGVATFTGCKIDKAGNGYTLIATDNTNGSIASATCWSSPT